MRRPLAAVLVALSAAACATDPAKDAPKAVVGTPAAPAAPATAPAAAEGAQTLAIDATASKLNWTGSKVTKSHPGGFKTFSGTITLVPGAIEKSGVAIEIDVGSIWTDSERLANHLKSEDFFDVKNHPKASFVSTAIVAGGAEGATHTVKGILTMHGVAKEISFPATIALTETGVAAKAKFALNRQDWKIAYKGAPDDLVRDDVLVEWDIVARRG